MSITSRITSTILHKHLHVHCTESLNELFSTKTWILSLHIFQKQNFSGIIVASSAIDRIFEIFGPIFEQNVATNFEPIFEQNVDFGPIFEKKMQNSVLFS